MKKLAIILILIFFTTNTHAVIFEQCYSTHFGSKKSDFQSFQSDKFEKKNYKVFSEGKIRQTIIFTDEYLKKAIKEDNELRKIAKEKHGVDTGLSDREKIKTQVYDITYFDEKFIKAKHQSLLIPSETDTVIKENINLNLKNGTVKRNYFVYFRDRLITNTETTIQCSLKKSKGSSDYLDYWWAVILIIAITFFIFTQSGKRLKKIRRK